MRKKTKNEKKSNNFLYSETYILLENMFEETQFILLYSHYRFFTWQVTGNAVTPTPIQTFISFVDAIPRSKILRNRLGILTQILDFNSNGLFLLFIYFRQVPFNLEKKIILILAISFIIKSITKGIAILAKLLFSFSIIVFRMKLLVIHFRRKKKHLLGNIFGSPHTNNRIYK